MTTKIYTIPYDSESKSWEPLVISTQVVNHANKETQKLDSKVQVEDAAGSRYPAMTNSLLLLEETEIVPQIEAGDVARIHLRLNTEDTRIHQILARNRRFKLKVTLLPDPYRGTGKSVQPGPPVEGVAEVVVEIRQVWDLTFRKVLWDEGKPIDLNTVEGIDRDALQNLGDWGGKLLLQPKGQLIDPGSGTQIASTQTIVDAHECTLDRGNGEKMVGEWDDVRKAYIFDVQPTQEGPAPAGVGGDVTVSPPIPPTQGWQRQLVRVLTAARKIGARLESEIPDLARNYVQGCLDYLAEKPEAALSERREELSIWVLNTTHFIEFMGQATEMFNKALTLFDTAFKRFLDNMVNFAVELIFSLFDVMSLVFKSATQSAKAALKGSTKEMVEQLSERTMVELTQRRVAIEQGVNASRTGLNTLDRQIAETWSRWPKDMSNPNRALLQQMEEVSGQAALLTEQRQQLYEQFVKQKKALLDAEANLLMTQEIKENAGEATEKEFLDKIKAKALALPDDPNLRNIIAELEQMAANDARQYAALNAQIRKALSELPPNAPTQARLALERLSADLDRAIQTLGVIDLNKETYSNLLVEGPVGERLKVIHERAQQAKNAAEAIRYQNMAWEHYQGFFSPLWWFMDWSLAQILWLHDLAVEWIPGLAMAENLLALCVDTVLGYLMSILNAMVDFMNSHHWTRSCINSEVRGIGKATALDNGVSAHFFAFPQATKDLVPALEPRRIVAMGQSGSAGEMQAVKQRLMTQAAGGYQQERNAQRAQARAAFVSLCRKVLDTSHLDQPAPEQLHGASLTAIWRQLVGPMVQYEEAFAASNAQGTDYLWSMGRFAQNSTFQDWDGAIEWLTWAVAWGLRLGSVLLVFTGFGIAAVPTAFAAAQGAEWLGAVLRPAVSWLGTMPDVIAFQYDIVIAAALVYAAATEGNVDLENLIVPSEVAE